MKNITLLGRPDGLGNRIEEVIRFEAFCKKDGLLGTYNWNNKIFNRSYPILVRSEQVILVELDETKNQTFDDREFLYSKLSQEEILKAAKRVKPTFDHSFPEGIEPFGIHLRGTDRIGKNHPHFLKDFNEFNLYLNKTIDLLNREQPKDLFICSDDSSYVDLIVKNLNFDVNLVKPVCDPNIPGEYVDFFALSLCQSIVMCSKFSTFSITASLLGNKPLIAFYRDEVMEERYRALFHYDLDFDNVTQRKLIQQRKLKLLMTKISDKAKQAIHQLKSYKKH